MSGPGRASWQLVLSCEHASPAVPVELHTLGLPAGLLRSHRSYDQGALPIAEALAAAFAVPLVRGQWSRLVADLNRSHDHGRVVARAVDGQPVPGNARLSAAERALRLWTYWAPYRSELRTRVAMAAAAGPVLHLSVHSFTPELGGVVRRNDLGLLFDPARPRERSVCEQLRAGLSAAGLSVRFNFPYFGHTDGVTTWLRGAFGARRYVGVEVECNQRLVATGAGQRQVARALVGALGPVLGAAAGAPEEPPRRRRSGAAPRRR